MIEAFITKHGGIYPFKHITYMYPNIDSPVLHIKLVSSNTLMDLNYTSVEDRNRQLHNFMQYLTKQEEPTTTELS